MIDFFLYRRHLSHYEQEAPGPMIEVTKPVLTTNEKIVEACKDLDGSPRQKYIPAPELTEEQKTMIELAKHELEIQRMRYDSGFWSPSPSKSSFRIRESEITDQDILNIFKDEI